MDIRDQIERHCEACPLQDTSRCGTCFFGSVDFGRPLLGSLETFNRAWRYLNRYRVRGYRREKPFGNYLEAPCRK